MFKVELKNLDNVVSWGAKFPTYNEALFWTQKQLLKEGRLQGDPDDFITDITAAHALEQSKIQSQKYLNDTDWYVIRKLERNIDVPEGVTQARLNAIEILNS